MENFFPRIDRMMCYIHALCIAALLKFGRHPRRLWLPWSPAAKKGTSTKDAEEEKEACFVDVAPNMSFPFTRLPCACAFYDSVENFLARGCDFIGHFFGSSSTLFFFGQLSHVSVGAPASLTQAR